VLDILTRTEGIEEVNGASLHHVRVGRTSWEVVGGWRTLSGNDSASGLFGCRALRFLQGADFDFRSVSFLAIAGGEFAGSNCK
jgi:hypothetical protein